MKLPMILAVQAAFATFAMPASADSAALPFWSRPFPYGFAAENPDCVRSYPVRTRRGVRRVVEDHCGPVIRSRG